MNPRNVYRFSNRVLCRSTPVLLEGDIERLVNAMDWAEACAVLFSEAEGVPLHARAWDGEAEKVRIPRKLEVFRDSEELAEALAAPERERGGTVVARVDLDAGVVYLSDKDALSDLYVELGKWFFYQHSTKWRSAELRLAESFADYCED